MLNPNVRTFAILVVALMTIAAPSAAQAASSENMVSPRLIALQKELQAGNRAVLSVLIFRKRDASVPSLVAQSSLRTSASRHRKSVGMRGNVSYLSAASYRSFGRS